MGLWGNKHVIQSWVFQTLSSTKKCLNFRLLKETLAKMWPLWLQASAELTLALVQCKAYFGTHQSQPVFCSQRKEWKGAFWLLCYWFDDHDHGTWPKCQWTFTGVISHWSVLWLFQKTVLELFITISEQCTWSYFDLGCWSPLSKFTR